MTPSISSRPSIRQAPWELNIWYHTLNCGHRNKISGETDFPCIYGERVGLGRVYVKLPDGHLDFDAWCEADRRKVIPRRRWSSHLIDFQVNDQKVGESGGELCFDLPATVKVTAQAAAFLDPKPSAEARSIHNRSLEQKPYWDLERSRIGETRKVPVEVIVNGESVGTTELAADGSIQGVSFDVRRSEAELLRKMDLPVLPHQPGLHHGRRQADPRLQEIGGMVPEIGRPVLVEEGAGHSRQ